MGNFDLVGNLTNFHFATNLFRWWKPSNYPLIPCRSDYWRLGSCHSCCSFRIVVRRTGQHSSVNTNQVGPTPLPLCPAWYLMKIEKEKKKRNWNFKQTTSVYSKTKGDTKLVQHLSLTRVLELRRLAAISSEQSSSEKCELVPSRYLIKSFTTSKQICDIEFESRCLANPFSRSQ